MSDCVEVLFVSDSSGRHQTASCINPHIGTTLMTYKNGGGAAKKCLSVIRDDYLISAEATKPILYIWPLNSQEPSHDLKIILPGKPSCMCVSPDGFYCITGIDGKIFIWQISSGALMNVVSKHYQPVNKIIFTDDSSHFITIGDDGLVLVWKLADLVTKQFGDIYKLKTSEVEPVYNLFYHSLPVIDAYVGRGGLRARLFTASADQTCKIYSLSSGTLVLSVVYDFVLTSVTVNELETKLFVGTSNGRIQVFNLDSYPRSLECSGSEDSPLSTTLSGHAKAVTCLSCSLNGTTLASGSDDEKVFLWNIPGRQLLQSFEMKGSITNLFFYFAPSNIFSNKFEPHSVCISKFEKVSSFSKKNLECNVLVNENVKPITVMEILNRFQKTDNIVEPKVGIKGDVTTLKNQVSMLKDVNKQLYQFAMEKILNNPVDFKDVN